MPGGLLQLSAYGSENSYVNGNPQITFFKSVYKRYTHFAMEMIEVPMEGPNELSYMSSIKLKAKIPRNGDLISNMYFKFRLPDIYSNSHQQFYWCKGVGLSMIDYVDLFIGGSKIERLEGVYLDIENNITNNRDKKDVFNKMTGYDDRLTYTATYNEHYYRGYNRSSYIGNPQNSSTPSNINKFYNSPPSIYAQDYYIPLHFWFSHHYGLALPLIALQYHDVEIEIQLKPLRDLYTILKPLKKYYYYANNEHLDYSSWQVVSPLDPSTTRTTASSNSNLKSFMSYIREKPDSISTIQGQEQHISQFIYGTFVDKTFDFRPLLDIQYIFLDTTERTVFAQSSHEFLITQIHRSSHEGLQGKNIVELESYHLCKEIMWVAKRSDNDTRNEWLNYTTHTNEPRGQLDEMFAWQDSWWMNCVEVSTNTPTTFVHAVDGSIICDRFQELLFRFGPYGEASYPRDLITNQPLSPLPNGDKTILGFTINENENVYSLETILDFRKLWLFTPPSKIPLIDYSNYIDYELNPIKSVLIKFNGYIRQEKRYSKFYNSVQPYQYHSGSSIKPIYVYSFSLEPEKYQPSGACNFSRIQTVEFEIDLKQTPISKKQIKGTSTITREYNFNVDFYFVNYNILKIMGGMGGLGFGN